MESDTENGGKKKGCEPEEDRPITGMESLPPDITLDILSRLPITSLVQFKLVCRPWCNLAHDPQLADMYLSCAGENDPCLIFHSDYPLQNQLSFVDINSQNGYQETVKTFNIPFRSVIPEFEVVGSCNGFLCLSNSSFGNPQYIYNPFTREYKELPQPSLLPDQMVVFGFGFHPMTKEYKVVRIAYAKYKHDGYAGGFRFGFPKLGVQIFTMGTDAWRDIGTAPYLLDSHSRASEALVNGSLHWIAKRVRNHRVIHYFIVSFDLASEQFEVVPRPEFSSLSRWNCHLVALKGYLSMVVCKNEVEIWVMKDYNEREPWTKEFTIKAYVPVGLRQHIDPPHDNGYNRRFDRIKVRVVCVLKNGEILLEYRSRALVSYHPDSEEFKDLRFRGFPKLFHTVTRVGSLISVDATNGFQR